MRHQHDVFDTHSDILFGNVDAWFDGKDHAFFKRLWKSARVMNINADKMAEAMREILTERFAVFVLAMRVDDSPWQSE